MQKVPALITKIIQTHETQLVRHGMMVVGEAGSGKTVNTMVLAKALTQLKKDNVVDKDGFFQVVQRYTLNPKSVTMGELYGEFNLTTQEWADGLVATLVRAAVADTTPNRKWMMFDGPVDALWIENMNTVLDDNKMLCLANGERIKLPPTVHMMFEVRDLAVASPATVSRCGMVFMEPVHVGVVPLVHSWAAGEIADYLPEHMARLVEMISEHLPTVLSYLRSNCREIIPSQDMNLVQSFLHMLTMLLSPKHGVRGPHCSTAPPRTAIQKVRERWAKSHGPKHAALLVDAHALGELGGAAGVDEDAAPAPAAAATAPAPIAAPAVSGAVTSPAPSPTSTAAEAEFEIAEKERAEHEDGGQRRRRRGGEAMEPDHLVRVVNLSYSFAMVWAFGGNLHDSSRAGFNEFLLDLLKDKLPPLPLPSPPRTDAEAAVAESQQQDSASGAAPDSLAMSDLSQYYVDTESGSLKHWASRLSSFT